MALEPPRGLDATGRAAWRRAVATLVELGEDPRLSYTALWLYADAAAMAALLRREWRRDGGAGMVVGPRGGRSEHPLLKPLRQAERHAHELGEALGLSPAGRRKLGTRTVGGRPAGAASAPDRAKVVPLRRRLRRDPSAS
jgi:P27 family predicted phage terminase small subunit